MKNLCLVVAWTLLFFESGASAMDAKVNRMDQSASDVELVAKAFVTGHPYPQDVRNVTYMYRWVSSGSLYWVVDRKLNRTLVVARLSPESAPVSLTGHTAALSDFVSKQFGGRFPGSAQVGDIVQLVKDAAIGPAAAIATENFCDRQHKRIGSWLRARQKSATVFRAMCTGIQTNTRENEWSVRFNVFNTGGGVDSVTVSGSAMPLAVDHVDVITLKPKGEFSFPLEG